MPSTMFYSISLLLACLIHFICQVNSFIEHERLQICAGSPTNIHGATLAQFSGCLRAMRLSPIPHFCTSSYHFFSGLYLSQCASSATCGVDVTTRAKRRAPFTSILCDSAAFSLLKQVVMEHADKTVGSYFGNYFASKNDAHIWSSFYIYSMLRAYLLVCNFWSFSACNTFFDRSLTTVRFKQHDTPDSLPGFAGIHSL